MCKNALFIGMLTAAIFLLSEISIYAQPRKGGQQGGGQSQGNIKRDKDNNPPGPKGGQGTNWENKPGPKGGPGASPDLRPKMDRDNNPPGAAGGPGTNWENKPGPQGGPGASPDRSPRSEVNKPWEKKADVNKDGVVDQAEFQQHKEQKAVVDKPWEKKADANQDGVVDKKEIKHLKKQGRDKDNNPPGPKGGQGTNWENKPGPKGGPGASPDRK